MSNLTAWRVVYMPWPSHWDTEALIVVAPQGNLQAVLDAVRAHRSKARIESMESLGDAVAVVDET